MPPNTPLQSDPLNETVQRINDANNILITVSNDPSVDQLAACIGLTVALNKKGKHATAVFSGAVPSTLEFLQPDRTIEKNTNSLRDFIISLDKSKADKLRYKVEDEFVKIFITPYRTSIDENDLAFTQGDFNIDLVITLGVHERQHLDAAIVAHGRILHDAPVVSLNTDTISDIGAINWVDTTASSLCEMTADLVNAVDTSLVDGQIATAFLTGMVAETDRFGNEKATPHTMSVSGVLMAAGASPQLITSKLQEPIPEPEPEQEPELEVADLADETAGETEVELSEPAEEEVVEAPRTDGVFEIDHSSDDIQIDEHGKLQALKDIEEAQAALALEAEQAELAAIAKAQAEPEVPDPTEEAPVELPELPALDESVFEETPIVGEDPERPYLTEEPPESPEPPTEGKLVLEPPQLGGQLTANSVAEQDQYSPSTDPLSAGNQTGPTLDHAKEADFPEESPEQTLSDLEKELDSPHVQPDVPDLPSVDDALKEVNDAINASDDFKPEATEAVGSTNVDLNLGHNPMDQILEEEAKQNNDSGNSPPPVPPPFTPGV